MGVVKVTPGTIRKTIRANGAVTRAVLTEAARIATKRAVTELKRISPYSDGVFRAAWHTTERGMSLTNDSPYAAVIERGARPHGVNKEGVERIREWVRKTITRVPALRGPGRGKMGPKQLVSRPLSRADASGAFAHWVDDITWGVVNKIKREGSKPHWLVRRNLDRFKQWAFEEFHKRFQKRLESTQTGSP
jgi:hypothetical protein